MITWGSSEWFYSVKSVLVCMFGQSFSTACTELLTKMKCTQKSTLSDPVSSFQNIIRATVLQWELVRMWLNHLIERIEKEKQWQYVPVRFICVFMCICGLNEHKIRAFVSLRTSFIEADALNIGKLNITSIHWHEEWSSVNRAALQKIWGTGTRESLAFLLAFVHPMYQTLKLQWSHRKYTTRKGCPFFGQ